MRRLLAIALLAVSGGLLSTPAASVETTASPGLSTLGLGAELSARVTPAFGVRLGYRRFGLSRDATIDDIDYTVRAELQSAALLLDWYPFRGGFRLTAGLLGNGNRLELDADSDGATLEVGDGRYRGDITLDGEAEFRPVAPFLGLGWDGGFGAGPWGWSVHAGVLFQGRPIVKLNGQGQAENLDTGQDIDVSSDEQFQSDLEETRSDIEDELGALELWPVIGASVTYRF